MQYWRLVSLAGLVVSLFAGSASASSDRTVRFWEGVQGPTTDHDSHLAFIANALAPGTKLIGRGALEHYIVYIPPNSNIPFESLLNKVPFSEAALPTYTNRAAYDKAQNTHPEYGPLHFAEDGFDPQGSYSATPEPYVRGTQIQIARQDPRSDRVAYDLRPYDEIRRALQLGPTDPVPEPNWHDGFVIAWLLMRHFDIDDADYLPTTQKLLNRMLDLQTAHNGHFARIGNGHVLHFVNFKSEAEMNSKIGEMVAVVENEFAEAFISIDPAVATPLAPFADGWNEAIAPGKAVNVQLD